MKFVPTLCLSLALFSPAFALRGTRRRLEDDSPNRAAFAEETAPLPEDFESEAVEESVPAPTVAVFDPNKSPPLYVKATNPPTRAPVATPVPAPNADVGEALTEVAFLPTDAPSAWGANSEWVLSLTAGDEAKHNSMGGSKSTSKSKDSSGSGDDGDALCSDFCSLYMATCEGANAFFDPDTPRGTPARRRLIEGEDFDTIRLSGSGVFESFGDCVSACADYPRPTNPADYLDPLDPGVNSIGDTFWCRKRHLELAADKKTHFAAQVHCPFAAPSGGGLCTNVAIFTDALVNATAYEIIRAGAETSRHLGYCQLYFNDLVADCTNAGIDDRTFKMALALIPISVEILIFNNNVGKKDPVTGNTIGTGITELPSLVFRGLICPECIKAVIMDDGNLNSIAADGLTALREVQSLSFNMQLLTSLPTGMLANAPFLREFSVYNTRAKPGLLTSIPGNLFSERATDMRRIVISGHRGLTTVPAGLFTGLDEALAVLILSNNGFTNTGITTTMFQNLGKLQVWDMSNNQFTTAEAGWLSLGWAMSLRNFYLQENPITIIQDGIFDYADCKLENVLLHDTDVISIPIGLFDFCQETLISYTVSPRV